MAHKHWLATIWSYVVGNQVELPANKLNRMKKDLGLNQRVVFRFSSSIGNFAERLIENFEVYQWHPIRSIFELTVFMGLYHVGDYWKFLWHRGRKIVFWCGGDILNLEKSVWRHVIPKIKANHICENEPEQTRLWKMGIKSEIHPILFFDDPNDYPLSFKPSKKPHVWLTCHPGREEEYGVTWVEFNAWRFPEITFHVFGINQDHLPKFDRDNKNIIYHGHVPSHEMDKMIRGYHCGLRTLDFDGCPHTVSKGVLLGQYPINKIPYPYTETYETTEELIKLLKNLKNKKKSNEGRKYWYDLEKDYPWNL